MGQAGFPDRINVKTDLEEPLMIKDISAIKNMGRFFHLFVDQTVIQSLEIVPFRHDYDR